MVHPGKHCYNLPQAVLNFSFYQQWISHCQPTGRRHNSTVTFCCLFSWNIPSTEHLRTNSLGNRLWDEYWGVPSGSASVWGVEEVRWAEEGVELWWVATKASANAMGSSGTGMSLHMGQTLMTLHQPVIGCRQPSEQRSDLGQVVSLARGNSWSRT